MGVAEGSRKAALSALPVILGCGASPDFRAFRGETMSETDNRVNATPDAGDTPAGVALGRRPRNLRRAVLVGACVAVLIAGAGIGAARFGGSGASDGAALAERWGLPGNHACGAETADFSPRPGMEKAEVFALTSTWHWAKNCLANILARTREESPSAPINDFLYAQVLYVLSQPAVRFYRLGDDARYKLTDVLGVDGRLDRSKFDRLVYTNDHGVAHNSMSQADLGAWFLDAKLAIAEHGGDPEAAATYEALGHAAIRVILDSVDEGGLRSRGECALKPGDQCSWYHAVTDPRRKSPKAGGTLNKHLRLRSPKPGVARWRTSSPRRRSRG